MWVYSLMGQWAVCFHLRLKFLLDRNWAWKIKHLFCPKESLTPEYWILNLLCAISRKLCHLSENVGMGSLNIILRVALCPPYKQDNTRYIHGYLNYRCKIILNNTIADKADLEIYDSHSNDNTPRWPGNKQVLITTENRDSIVNLVKKMFQSQKVIEIMMVVWLLRS